MKEGEGKEIAYILHSTMLSFFPRVLLTVVERTRKNKLRARYCLLSFSQRFH